MYIKFCRSYGEEKKDLSPESKLSVELEGKGKQTEGNTRLYRAACLVLTIFCLVLLLVVIILSMKLQTGSEACPQGAETSVGMDSRSSSFEPTCNYQQCQANFHNVQPEHLGCQQCADGWLTLGKSCFYLSTFRLSWDESQRNCSSRGGSLAVVSSQTIQSFLTDKGKMQYWIGLRHNGATWTWVNNTVLTQSYWKGGAPEKGCVILGREGASHQNWLTANCQAYSYFVCQVQM